MRTAKSAHRFIRAFLKFATLQPSARLYMIFHSQELLPAIEELLDKEPGSRDHIILAGEKTA